jgi:(p)ppGpp synthase/HD superfamily hydrolase
VHPVHVSVILLRHSFPEDVAIAGLLHDVVEDQDIPLADVEARFGPHVAEMVAALTERKGDRRCKRAWEVRKQEALDQLKEAGPEAMAVKAADVLHNTRTLTRQLRRHGPSVWSHYSRGPQPSLWYARSVLAIARDRLGTHPLIDELHGAIGDLEQNVAEAGTS